MTVETEREILMKECDIFRRGGSEHTITLLHIFRGSGPPTTPQDLTPLLLLLCAHDCSICSLSSTSLVNRLILTILSNRYVVASSAEQFSQTIDVRNVLDFIKETHFYDTL